MHHKIILLFFLIGSTVLQAQQLDHVLGDMIVRLSPKVEQPTALIQQYKRFKGKATGFTTKKCLNEDQNIWLLHFDFTNINEYQLLRDLRSNKLVDIAQFNHLIKKRKIPNDSFFSFQWNLMNTGGNGGIVDADIDMELAWDITTGGLTPEGDTIVIAVVDDGVDLDHEDLQANLWKNHKEIPNNGIDDDNNGFIDDFHGWNIDTNSDAVDNTAQVSLSHGTEVAGVIGAVGNNNIGLTGVNWQVKLMIISPYGSTNADEASAIEGYSYVLSMRKKYNETNGAEGAFVVATNSSWGTDNQMESDAPLWCEFYNLMGEEGIINTVATVNENINIDTEGDLPTTCSSPYLIGVTNTTNRDQRAIAGYGPVSVDIAAPAENIPIITQDSKYRYQNFNQNGSGTSYAAPQVAGVIGLMYASPCTNFSRIAKQNPARTALLAKEYIFRGVEVQENLVGLTVTGGRLNANNSLELLMADCGSCPTPVSIDLSSTSSNTLSVDWVIDNSINTTLRYRMNGQGSWMTISNLQPPYVIDNLVSCTDYEIQLASQCDGEPLSFTNSSFQTTEGCCKAPSSIEITDITTSSVTSSWNTIIDAGTDEVQWQKTGTSNWESTIVTDTFYTITGQEICTQYLVRVRPICTNRTTTFSDSFGFKTKGCGTCTDAAYCTSIGENTDFEWISSVQINELNNTSSSDDGYGDFTDLSTTLNTFETYNITIEAGYNSGVFEEFFKVWIDYNQDGQFDNNTELAFNSGAAMINGAEGQITIPGDAVAGNTRMRVAMKASQSSTTQSPTACETIDFGEVEDYCVNIITGSFNCIPPSITNSTTTNTSIQLNLIDVESASTYKVRYRPIGNSNWQEQIFNAGMAVELKNLTACITYDIQVATVCADGNTSSFSTLTNIATTCNCSAPTNITVTPIDSTGFELNWTGIGTSYEVFLGATDLSITRNWTINDSRLVVNNLPPCKDFDVNITTFCQAERGAFIEERISSPCPTSINTLPTEINHIQIAPNPFRAALNLQLELQDATLLQVTLHQMNGQEVWKNNMGLLAAGQQNLDLNIPDLVGGIYLLKISTESGNTVRKVVKIQ